MKISAAVDDPRPNEVLVRVVACGVCHTDIGIQRLVPKPIVLGHEGSGIVERVGSAVTKVKVGDRVVLTFGSCGVCASCVEGEPAYCHDMRRLQFSGARADGSPTMRQGASPVHGAFFQQSAFATYALATERNVVPVGSDVPLELLGPLGCGVQTGAGAVINALAVRTGASLAVFGVGSVGLSAVMAARIVGATTIIAVDVNPVRLETARSLGATHAIDARSGDVTARIQEITAGGANFSLEASGVETSFNAAVECLAIRGTCGFVTAPRQGQAFPFSLAPILLRGRRLMGILEGSSVPDRFIPRLIELYRQGRFPMDRLATYYPFADINRAMDDSHYGRAIKPILRM